MGSHKNTDLLEEGAEVANSCKVKASFLAPCHNILATLIVREAQLHSGIN